ncbi:hypothetical protein [Oxalicibacterium faecigallinarum]|uniref:DUF342 domain-containing protein n=1 Tax=Oxalicibacterium faecigallinarum TaxID=573741 RepID=A0A8J3F454_9BURK|nr:hypothetical protein [Oxalicibacterium faecigallinarum]GGI21672.1 hypothetical protein GCM10008066_30220 [Oxalicibacterium faecigallinarum]
MRPPLTRFRRASAARRMRGIATVLIMLLVGLGLTAAVLGTVAYIRGNQSQDISSHAQAQAQAKAWTGAEIVLQYLQSLNATQMTNLRAKIIGTQLNFSGNGVAGITATLAAVNNTEQSLTFNITGTTASGSRAEATSTLAVVYGPGTGTGTGSGGSSGGAAGTCGAQPKASTVFRGSVNISGGESAFVSGENYADIAVDGNLTIANASQAIISGCTKGDITLSGGGIDANATLSSQNGTITINSMSTPTNATLWARAVNIGNSGNGTYAAIKAGAYLSNVVVSGATVGTAPVGGRLLTAGAGPSLPWVTGFVVPWNTGKLLITMTDGAQHLIDMTKVSINSDTGAVSGALAASTKVNTAGTSAAPDAFRLQSTSIAGGSVDIYTLTVAQLWGYGVNVQGYSGTYTNVLAAGNFKIVTGNITNLTGGNEMWAPSGGCSSATNCWNFPEVSGTGRLAGTIFYGSGKTALSGTRPNVLISQANTTPGLPGAPFCDTRTDSIDVTSYKPLANYIFFFDSSGNPRLTIQNVKTSSGTAIDRTDINLKTVDLPLPTVSPQLRQISGMDFMACNNQSASNMYNDALACFRNATTSSGWDLTGITKFPPGIAFFEGPLRINGVSGSQTLYNTFLATGAVTLTSSGHGPLVAPNLANPLSAVCDGNFYPSNLCNKTTTPSTLATWTDSAGTVHRGLPLANVAVGSNQGMTSSGWTITGSVILGGALSTSGSLTTINGALTVGSNATSATTITAGGIKVDTSKLTADQGFQPGTSCGTTTPAQPMRIRWARYL